MKKLTLILIAALAAVSGWQMGYGRVLPQAAAAVATAMALDVAVVLMRQKKLVWSDSAAITGLIIAGVAAPQTSWIMAAALAAAAIFSKHLIRFDRRNIFNPAAFGLFLGMLVLGVRLSWWIDSMHLLTIVLGAFLLAKFAGRWRMVMTFLAVFAGLLAVYAWKTNDPLIDVWFQYVSITSFFVFFMATDPRTSPIVPRHLPAFAAIAAAGSFLAVIFHPISIFLGGLLLANLFTPLFNRAALKRPAAPAAAATKGTASAAPTGPVPGAGA